MKPSLINLWLASFLIVALCSQSCAEDPAGAAEFTQLFDGKTLEGWDGDPRFWRVEDDAIVGQTTSETNPQQNTFLIYKGGEFGNFELRLSYQVEGYNSGVQYRSVDEGNWVVSGYQCDFEAQWHQVKEDPNAAPIDKFTGMLFDEKGRMFMGQRGEAVIVRTNPENTKKPLIEKLASVGAAVDLETHIKRDDWNDLVVIANGNQFTHIINGQVMAMGIDEDTVNRRESGVFAFQLHKGPPMRIRLKDIRVRRLGETKSGTSQPAPPDSSHSSPAPVDKVSADLAPATNLFRQYEQHALTHSGDPGKGQALFQDRRTKCNVCHTIDGKGGQVGVDLSRIGGKFDRPHLIESLLDPSRQIVEGFRTTNLLTMNGKVVSGILKKQSDQQVTIVDAAAKEHVIASDDIEELSTSSVSIMPDGLASALSLEEFTDLIAYLESLRGGVKAKMGSGVAGPISVPQGFALETVVTGLDGVTALDILPDGRILICEQPGRVRVVEDGELLEEPFVSLPVDSHWERGVIGATHDPEFPTQPYIYVCWVAKTPYPHHRVSRFTMQGNRAIRDSEKLLFTGDDQTKMGGKVPAGHQGGALHFGSDGKLYLAIGEQTAGAPSQELDTFLGKILRINSDGSIPLDNPLLNQTQGKYQAIWAYGCRNPFTFAVRKPDGLMLINDVGGKSEEVNVGRAGANYGWPIVEHGDMPEYQTDQYDGPIHWYKESSINGGDFCPVNSNWPEQWRGRYFFADFVQGWIRSLDPDQPSDVSTFVDGIRRPVDLRFAPDGSLYVLLRNAWVVDDKFEGGTGSLMRIRFRETFVSDVPPGETNPAVVTLTEDADDDSADGLPAFKIETPSATYYLEKSGGGLSSLIDREGKDWLGFHPRKASGASGEYRGFPNAVYKQGGNYFHARNSQTDEMRTRVERVDNDYVSILAESLDGKWQGRYEFFTTHCTFAITKMPPDRKYWVLYEGTPGGTLDMDDWWMTSAIKTPQPISQRHDQDIPALEWIAFGDADAQRCIVLHCDTDDQHPDCFYQMQEKMTVFGFGREKLNAFHTSPGHRFSIALVENKTHPDISKAVKNFVTSTNHE